MVSFMRNTAHTLRKRLYENRNKIQILVGPRQTGKTFAIKQAVNEIKVPVHVAAADSLRMPGSDWIELQWLQARRLASRGPAVLVLDEIQKVRGWAETVKALWDEDSWNDLPLKVVLSGSSSPLLEKGSTESLMGRYELIRSTHWSLAEMKEAFGYSLDDYLMYGGFPGAAALRTSKARWKRYMKDSIIEATISQDVLQLSDEVRKPALMRALFELGAQYSAQELSYRKILGQLDDRGNTETVKHYLDLLSKAGMMSGLQKYENKEIKSRASSPRLMVHDPSLMTASWSGRTSILEDPATRGHLVETAVGAALLARAVKEDFDLYWWRDGDKGVDFVIRQEDSLIAIEVKSGRVKRSGIVDFCRLHPKAQPIVVGDRSTPVEAFLLGEVPLFD